MALLALAKSKTRQTPTRQGGLLDIYRTKQIRQYEALAGKEGIELPEKPETKKPLLEKIIKPLNALLYTSGANIRLGRQLEEQRKKGVPFLKRLVSPESRQLLKRQVFSPYAIYKGYKEKTIPSEELRVKERFKEKGLRGGTAAAIATDIAADPFTYLGARTLKAGVKLAGKPLGKVAAKIPGVEILGRAFKPHYEVTKLLPKQMSDDFLKSLNKVYKGTSFEASKAIDEIVGLAKEARKINPQAGKIISEALETATKTTTGKVFRAGASKLDESARLIAEDFKVMLKEGKARGLITAEIDNYVPHILTKEGRAAVQQAGGISAILPKPLRAKLSAAEPRKLEGTITEINQYLGNWLGQKLGKPAASFFEPDVFKVYAARKVSNIKAIKIHDFLQDTAKRFGVAADGQEAKYVGGLKYTKSSAAQLKDVLVPEPIAKEIDQVKEIIGNEKVLNSFLKVYDKALGFWKGSVTGIAPSFHLRNFMGGSFNNYLAGLKNPVRYMQADKLLRAKWAGKDLSKIIVHTKKYGNINAGEVLEEYAKRGGIGQTGLWDVMKTVEEQATKVGGKKVISKVAEAPRTAMTAVENRLRLPLFLDRLTKGDTFDDAMKAVYKYHFDYAPEALTAFERNVMRRLIPFYRWTRGNIPLQIESLATQPRKYAPILRGLQTQLTPEEQQFMPEWMQEQTPLKYGGEEGKPKFLSALGLPYEDIGRLWRGDVKRTLEREVVGGGTPALSWLYQYLTGRSAFLGKPIEEMKYLSEAEGKVVEKYPEKVKKFFGFRKEVNKKNKKTYYIVNPNKWVWFKTMSGKTGIAATKPKQFLIPAKTYEVDIEKEKKRRQIKYQQALEKRLLERGLVKEFKNTYIPR